MANAPRSPRANEAKPSYMRSLADSIRTADGLIDALGLPERLREPARAAEKLFPVFAPRSFLARMRPGDEHDPLLRQVLPLGGEGAPPPPAPCRACCTSIAAGRC
ncbi:hypothetical protein [Alienimonas chondri]|uniref:hypothetical protein n=1 Tax=Alienimonas chondri TaxID=2681879 RepID=UPI001FECBC84|nr:hypothetical protein [Alienimonas chondri]